MKTPPLQLDIFEHSRDLMLKNDVINALQARDSGAAQRSRAAYCCEYPKTTDLPDLDAMLEALEKPTPGIHTHQDLEHVAQWLADCIEPAARRVLGERLGKDWLLPQWQALAKGAAALPFQANAPLAHAASIWLRMGAWNEVALATKSIASWRKKPIPLGWMLHANLELFGLQPSLGLLAELAWMAPGRLATLVLATTEVQLKRLVKKFEADFAGFQSAQDLAWFPAWLLIERPSFVASMAQAQACNQCDAEMAMRSMVALLGLERQGRQRDIIAERRHLKDLNADLFAAYLGLR